MIKNNNQQCRPITSQRISKIYSEMIIPPTRFRSLFEVFSLSLMISITSNEKNKKIKLLKDFLLTKLSNFNTVILMKNFNIFSEIFKLGLDFKEIVLSNDLEKISAVVICLKNIFEEILQDPFQIDSTETQSLTKSNKKILEKICKKLNITLIILKKNSNFWLCGCEQKSIVVSICEDDGYSVLVPQMCFNDFKEFPYFYELPGNIFRLIKKTWKIMRNKIKISEKKNLLLLIRQISDKSKYFPLLHNEIVEFCEINILENCNHEFLMLFESNCKNLHCLTCLVNYSKNFQPLQWECSCKIKLSPKIYREMCEKYEDLYLRKKSKSNKINEDLKKIDILKINSKRADKSLKTNNFQCQYCLETKNLSEKARQNNVCLTCFETFNLRPTKSPNFSEKKEKNEIISIQKVINQDNLDSGLHYQVKKLNSYDPCSMSTCGVCNFSKSSDYFSIKCSSHNICNECRCKNKELCQLCYRKYSIQEMTLLNLKEEEKKNENNFLCDLCGLIKTSALQNKDLKCHVICNKCSAPNNKCKICEINDCSFCKLKVEHAQDHIHCSRCKLKMHRNCFVSNTKNSDSKICLTCSNSFA